MKFLEEHRLEITTLTPVHIGCGEDYTPTDYVIDEDALFTFNSAVVSQVLLDRDPDELMKLVKGKPQDNMLQNLQKFFWEHRQPLMAKANHYLPVARGVADLYQDRIGQTAGPKGDGKKVINKLEIERTFYNPVSQKPVIPGSSLKGAIRTALLDSINNGKPLCPEEKLGMRRNKGDVNRKLQARLFRFDQNRFEQDPMRLVRLADTEGIKGEAITSKIQFAINYPRQERVNQQGRNDGSGATKSSLSPLLETMPESGLRAFSSRLTIQKVEQLSTDSKIPATGRCWTMEQIAEACNRFYRRLLEQEMDILRKRGYVSPDWGKRMVKLLAGIKPMLDANKAMLLRIGKHSGAEAVTLNGVRNIKIMKGKMPPEYKCQPTTIWLGADTKDQRTGMTPFGWALIEIDPPDTPLPVVEDFTVTGQHNDDRRQWLEKTRQRIAKAQEELERRKKQAEEKKENQLAEGKRKREEAERLAAMTNQQRELEELRKRFEEEKAQGRLRPQGPVAESVAKLLRSAPDWPEKEDRHALADLAETIYKEIGMLKGKKGRERKEEIKKLRDS